MGEGKVKTQFTCTLGDFFSKGDSVFIEAGEELRGRYVQTTFRITDQLLNYINGDVLKSIKAEVRYERVVRTSNNTLFLVYGQEGKKEPQDTERPKLVLVGAPEVNDDHEEADQTAPDLEAKWLPFAYGLKIGLQDVFRENDDLYYEIQHGNRPTPRVTDRVTTEPSTSVDISSSMAVHSNAHF